VSCAKPAEDTVFQRPNVVVILVDDLGARDVGFMGSTFYETPHTDALAADGMHFTQAYAAHPVCSPTRAALLTGRDPARLGITQWLPGFRAVEPLLRDPPIPTELALEETTLAEVFRSAGYVTFFAGKWHLGEDPAYWPENQGFDFNIGGFSRGAPPGGYFAPYENPRLPDGPDGEFLTERLGRETTTFIRDHADQPFFVYLSFYTVHTPIQPTPAHGDRFRAKAAALPASLPTQDERYGAQTLQGQDNPDYASMVAAFDDVVGAVRETLETSGLADNTIIVLASDNGGAATGFAERKPGPTSNAPLRAGKGWLYEGGIRTPLIIRAPGLTEPGSVSDALITSTDLFPTVVSLAGLLPPSDQVIDGQDYAAYLAGEEPPDRGAIVWHFPHYNARGWRPGTAIRLGDWKLITFYETGEQELFNLVDDPFETTNLSDQYPDVTARLNSAQDAWRKDTGALMPTRAGPPVE
jgi:arylsulfatase A-like enzyme